MPRLGSVAAISFGLLVFVLAAASRGEYLDDRGGQKLTVLTRRAAATDLEVRGLADGPRFVPRSSLLTLPQREALVKRSEDFAEVPADGVRVQGVDFGVLLRALGVGQAAGKVAVQAVCSDGYDPTFPPEYVGQHHPILILMVEGLSPGAWAEKTHTSDLGPYFVAYSDFVPAFHVLSHEDRQQLPIGMVRLEIAPEERMFAGIKPPGAEKLRADSPVMQGYRIAQQNCFRCHSAAGYGGTKSPRSWRYLSGVAKKNPERFMRWVHDPQSIHPKSEMPPNTQYDRDTLTALTRYFAALPSEGD
jgi:mono/diheme cytochrome c family protein